ncbi:MAG: helix-turn-helix domain-containing protein [Thermoguttaceae bacterium]|jgi:hypothetical protein
MPDAPKRRGRPASLDEEKRAQIVALLANGSSRRVATTIVGCSPSTLTRTASRDPTFAEQLARAERNVEIEALRAIRHAAKLPCYWRAAAWMLERRNPDDFAHRPPKQFTRVEVLQIVSTVCEMLVGDVPEENCQRAQEYLERLMLDLRSELASAEGVTPAALAPPPAEDPAEQEKGDSPHLCEARSGPFRQMGTVPFFPNPPDDDESATTNAIIATHPPILGTNFASFDTVSCVVSQDLQTSCVFPQHVPHLWHEVAANAGEFNTLPGNDLRTCSSDGTF